MRYILLALTLLVFSTTTIAEEQNTEKWTPRDDSHIPAQRLFTSTIRSFI
jgi:hypothetical protein